MFSFTPRRSPLVSLIPDRKLSHSSSTTTEDDSYIDDEKSLSSDYTISDEETNDALAMNFIHQEYIKAYGASCIDITIREKATTIPK